MKGGFEQTKDSFAQVRWLLEIPAETADAGRKIERMQESRGNQAAAGRHSYQRTGTDLVGSDAEKAEIALEVLADMKSIYGKLEPGVLETMFSLSTGEPGRKPGKRLLHIVYLGIGSTVRRELYQSYSKQIMDILVQLFPGLTSEISGKKEVEQENVKEKTGETDLTNGRKEYRKAQVRNYMDKLYHNDRAVPPEDGSVHG